LIQTYASTNGGITGNSWRVTRSGTGKDTNYILIPGLPDTEPYDWTGLEPYDLDEYAVRRIPYSDQEAHFAEEGGFGSFGSTASASSEPASASSDIW
jgi:hypothetical protein